MFLRSTNIIIIILFIGIDTNNNICTMRLEPQSLSGGFPNLIGGHALKSIHRYFIEDLNATVGCHGLIHTDLHSRVVALALCWLPTGYNISVHMYGP